MASQKCIWIVEIRYRVDLSELYDFYDIDQNVAKNNPDYNFICCFGFTSTTDYINNNSRFMKIRFHHVTRNSLKDNSFAITRSMEHEQKNVPVSVQ